MYVWTTPNPIPVQVLEEQRIEEKKKKTGYFGKG